MNGTMLKEIETDQSYRNSLSTISKEGKRVWIYPKKPSGRFHNARVITAIILLLIMVVTPFIKVNGHPFMLFHILERKFILFGIAFGPHDFHLFLLAFVSFIIFIVLFTAVYGRVFCGWACPQTIFMEMVFRKIEYFIEGDFRDQKKLDQSPWTKEKFIKKFSKHIIFFGLSFVVANILLAYIIGIDELYDIITVPPSQHLTGFIAITLFSGLFYFIFARFREQACTIVCPYGRLQGVLLDPNSIVVAYDNVRGEPRGKISKEDTREKGDCIDCHLCVDVCPTGIDIRNGIQLECVNCTACIDACDEVMEKINKPRGLIRYASQNSIEKKIGFKITPRIIVYSVILLILISITGYLLSQRTVLSANILRTPGMLYQNQPENKISNLYNLNLVNKSFDKKKVELELMNRKGEIKILGGELILEPQQVYEGKFMVILSEDEIDMLNVPLIISVKMDGQEIKQIKTAFLSNYGAVK